MATLTPNDIHGRLKELPWADKKRAPALSLISDVIEAITKGRADEAFCSLVRTMAFLPPEDRQKLNKIAGVMQANYINKISDELGLCIKDSISKDRNH